MDTDRHAASRGKASYFKSPPKINDAKITTPPPNSTNFTPKLSLPKDSEDERGM